VIQVLHTSIAQVESAKGSSAILLFLKDFRRLWFEFQTIEECRDTVACLERLSSPGTATHT